MYVYSEHRPYVFTEEGQTKLLAMIGAARRAFDVAGAVRQHVLISAASGGDGWRLIALVDRLVELGYLREVTGDSCMGQHRVFVEGKPLP